MEGARNNGFRVLSEQQLTHLHNVKGKPSKWRKRVNEAIPQVARIQARIQNCVLPIFITLFLGSRGCYHSLPRGLTLILANSYMVIVPLSVYITCKIATPAFNFILEQAKPNYNAYLKNRVNYQLRSNMDTHPAKYIRASEYVWFIKNDPALKKQCIEDIQRSFRVHWLAELTRLRQGNILPQKALQFAHYIPFEEMKQTWMATLKPFYATYSLETGTRLLNQRNVQEARQFAASIPYHDVRQQCIDQIVFEENLQKLLASDEADLTKIERIVSVLDRCNMHQQRTVLQYALKNHHPRLIKQCRKMLMEDTLLRPEWERALLNHDCTTILQCIADGVNVEMRDAQKSTALILAARQAQVDTVAALLAAGAECNAQDERGNTALTVAIEQGAVEVAVKLLQAGAQTCNTYSPLTLAADHGQRQIVTAFLAHGSNINEQDPEGHTALSRAAARGHVDLVRDLIQARASLDIRVSVRGDTAVTAAILHCRPSIVSLLVRAGASIPPLAVDIAIKNGYVDCLIALKNIKAFQFLTKDAVIKALIKQENGVSILTKILVEDDAFSREFFLTLKGIEFTQREEQQLLAALNRKVLRLDVLSGLLDHLEGSTPLTRAIQQEDSDALRQCIQAKLSLNAITRQGTPLALAASKGQVESISALLAAGADINFQDHEGHTALTKAVWHRQAGSILFLVAAKANSKLRTRADRTAAGIAIESAYVGGLIALKSLEKIKDMPKEALISGLSQQEHRVSEFTKILIGQYGFPKEFISLLKRIKFTPAEEQRLLQALNRDILSADMLSELLDHFEGSTALTRAIVQENTAAIKPHMLSKSSLNAKTRDGRTALMVAASTGKPEVVSALLAAGAELNAQDQEGQTALIRAVLNHHLPIVCLLVAAGANIKPHTKADKTAASLAIEQGTIDCLLALRNMEALRSGDLSKGAFINELIKEEKGISKLTNILVNNDTFSKGIITLLNEVEFSHTEGQALLRALDQNVVQIELSSLINHLDGSTALTRAIERRDVASALQYIRIKAGLNAKKRSTGHTPLMLAVLNGQQDVIAALITARADLNLQDQKGYTALARAAVCGLDESARMLIEAQADLNKSTETGDTPLMLALFHRKPGIVMLLVAAGANFYLKTSTGMTAAEIAVNRGSIDLVLATQNLDFIRTLSPHHLTEELRKPQYNQVAKKLDDDHRKKNGLPPSYDTAASSESHTPLPEQPVKGQKAPPAYK